MVHRQIPLRYRSSSVPPATQACLSDDLLRVDGRVFADESLKIVHRVTDRHTDPLRSQVKGQECLDDAAVFHDGDPSVRTVPVHCPREGQGEEGVLQIRARLLETGPQARLPGTEVTGPTTVTRIRLTSVD